MDIKLNAHLGCKKNFLFIWLVAVDVHAYRSSRTASATQSIDNSGAILKRNDYALNKCINYQWALSDVGCRDQRPADANKMLDDYVRGFKLLLIFSTKFSLIWKFSPSQKFSLMICLQFTSPNASFPLVHSLQLISFPLQSNFSRLLTLSHSVIAAPPSPQSPACNSASKYQKHLASRMPLIQCNHCNHSLLLFIWLIFSFISSRARMSISALYTITSSVRSK